MLGGVPLTISGSRKTMRLLGSALLSPWVVRRASRRCGARHLLIVLAHIGFCLVFRANTNAVATIQVAQGPNVISTGPYAVIRHPMYASNLPMVLGAALALGSWWGTLMVVPMIAARVARTLNEERYLAINLAGYADYKRKVRYRLIASVW
jgi:protein-S-isoprenylcysteine O-methyltransferase Ste14